MNKEFETEIELLNILVTMRIAPSEIHGVGVFAIDDIPAGTKLYADRPPEIFTLPYGQFDKLRPSVKDILLERWPLIAKGSAFVYPDARGVAYMNHSDDANYDAVNDETLKDIKKGDEITEDYKKIEGWKDVFAFLSN